MTGKPKIQQYGLNGTKGDNGKNIMRREGKRKYDIYMFFV